ncbi:hypothetical protein HK097_007174 [Rhizophlyctis rosea]|uniref:GHMP kinase N-terminal domain-containing protein n=1 Tax=Rhizophlyctis rosea TaxID=64517 RepID=A0AAD5SEY3_9FUNG|nr:hypothetical protein HK097_007174 [Rhizophlyctis rosea]
MREKGLLDPSADSAQPVVSLNSNLFFMRLPVTILNEMHRYLEHCIELFPDNDLPSEHEDDENTSASLLSKWITTKFPSVKLDLRKLEVNGWADPNLTLQQYLTKWATFTPTTFSTSNLPTSPTHPRIPITSRCYARCGLMGNPSDGFYGKTLSITLRNWYAEVTLHPNASANDQTIRIISNSVCDPHHFFSISGVGSVCATDGFDGAIRLFLACMKVFTAYCGENEIALYGSGFMITYEINIPRQVGLAGSSALIIALLKSLMQWYHIPAEVIPPQIQANLALAAERDELGVAAGYQDRVIQAYEGCVFMNFERGLLEGQGYGDYERIPVESLPKGLWLAYIAQPEDSGKVHSNVKAKFQAGDAEVISAMKQFAALAQQARDALISRNFGIIPSLMNQNFDLRRKLYGDEVIGQKNLEMIEVARAHGHAAKFCGSGGCIVGLCEGKDGEEEMRSKTKRMRDEFQRRGKDPSESVQSQKKR